MSTTPTGPNQQDQHDQHTSDKQQQQQEHGKNPAQHHGGVGNRQDEPQTADEAKKRAAEDARRSK